jgi:hypothetical protein
MRDVITQVVPQVSAVAHVVSLSETDRLYGPALAPLLQQGFDVAGRHGA